MFGKVPENVYSRGRDLFLLYLMKEQQKDQTKLFDIFILFEIQIEKKLWEKRSLKIKAKIIKKC